MGQGTSATMKTDCTLVESFPELPALTKKEEISLTVDVMIGASVGFFFEICSLFSTLAYYNN